VSRCNNPIMHEKLPAVHVIDSEVHDVDAWNALQA